MAWISFNFTKKKQLHENNCSEVPNMLFACFVRRGIFMQINLFPRRRFLPNWNYSNRNDAPTIRKLPRRYSVDCVRKRCAALLLLLRLPPSSAVLWRRQRQQSAVNNECWRSRNLLLLFSRYDKLWRDGSVKVLASFPRFPFYWKSKLARDLKETCL